MQRFSFDGLSIPLYDDASLVGGDVVRFVGITEVCGALSLTPKAQVRKIQSDLLALVRVENIPMLNVDDLNKWLGTIKQGALTPIQQAALEDYKLNLANCARGHKENNVATELVNAANGTKKAVPSTASTVTTITIDPRHQIYVHNQDWIVVTPICKAMGLDPEGQKQLLLRQSWAVNNGFAKTMSVKLPGTTAAREHFCLHRRRFAMWMAIIPKDLVPEGEHMQVFFTYRDSGPDSLDNYYTARAATHANGTQEQFQAIMGAIHNGNGSVLRELKTFITDLVAAALPKKIEDTTGFFRATEVADLLKLVTTARNRYSAARLVGGLAREARIHEDSPNLTVEEREALPRFGKKFMLTHEGVNDLGEDRTAIDHWRYNTAGMQKVKEMAISKGYLDAMGNPTNKKNGESKAEETLG